MEKRRRLGRLGFGALTGLMLLAAGAATACEDIDGAAPLTADGYRLSYAFDPPGPPIRTPFALSIRVCGPEGPFEGKLKADADMPAHGHSMNYSPKISLTAPGKYRADGFFFHMPGSWRLRFEVGTDAAPVRLSRIVSPS